MKTKIIGIKKFRENFTSLWKESQKKKIRYIVMYHSLPVLDVKPIDEEEIFSKELEKEIAIARKEVKEGKTFTEEEVYKRFRL